MTEHIVAIFATDGAADTAARALEGAGVPASAIRRYRAEAGDRIGSSSSERTTEATSSSGGGFWAWLLGEEGTETTRAAYPRDEEWYDRRVSAGNTVLSVTLDDDSRIHQATAILESHHPIEIEESTEEGESTSGLTSGEQRVVPSSVLGAGATGATMSHSPQHADSPEDVIPLAEEDIQVGKRTVDRGTTRLRRYVVETPVERQVTLHGERVTIEHRRPVATSVADHAFEERTVEVHETEEVPVVEKTARVVEEVAIRKEATERTETLHDTVRREEVEVIKDPGVAGGPATSNQPRT